MKDNNEKYKNNLMVEAASIISKLASDNATKDKELEAVKFENARLQLSLTATERSRRSLELAESMYKKKMISREQILEKAREFMRLNDESFAILKEMVDNKPLAEGSEAMALEDGDLEGDIVKQTFDKNAMQQERMLDKIINTK